MNPFLLRSLLAFAPSMLSGLFGDPKKKLRKQVSKLTSAENLGRQTNAFYNQNLASPAYSQAQGNIAAGANATSNQLANSLGARGIGTSGTSAILSSLVPSIVGQQQAGLRTSAFGAAQDQAQQAITRQLETLLDTQGPSQTQMALGRGFESLGPILEEFLRTRGQRGLPINSLQIAGGQFNPLPAPRGGYFS
jgi:hypothetical protein